MPRTKGSPNKKDLVKYGHLPKEALATKEPLPKKTKEYVTLIPNTMNQGAVQCSAMYENKLDKVVLYPRKKTLVPVTIANQLYENQSRVNRSMAVPDGDDLDNRMEVGKGGDGQSQFDKPIYEQPKGYTIIFHDRN